jgi:hypothetical protein
VRVRLGRPAVSVESLEHDVGTACIRCSMDVMFRDQPDAASTCSSPAPHMLPCPERMHTEDTQEVRAKPCLAEVPCMWHVGWLLKTCTDGCRVAEGGAEGCTDIALGRCVTCQAFTAVSGDAACPTCYLARCSTPDCARSSIPTVAVLGTGR